MALPMRKAKSKRENEKRRKERKLHAKSKGKGKHTAVCIPDTDSACHILDLSDYQVVGDKFYGLGLYVAGIQFCIS